MKVGDLVKLSSLWWRTTSRGVIVAPSSVERLWLVLVDGDIQHIAELELEAIRESR